MKTKTTQSPATLKAIDKQLKAILAKDVRKIQETGVRRAAFLQLIAA